jgi:hypothetical protein
MLEKRGGPEILNIWDKRGDRSTHTNMRRKKGRPANKNMRIKKWCSANIKYERNKGAYRR